MRIMNILLTRKPGGDAVMALRYHEALITEGFDVLNVGHSQGPLAEALGQGRGGLGFQPLDVNGFNHVIAAFQLAQIASRFRPDLVLAHSNKASRLCLTPGIGTRTKTVQVLHAPTFKPHLSHLNAALCVSHNMAEGVKQVFPGLKVFEMTNFAHLKAQPVKSAPRDVPVIGAMGRLHEIKGFDVLIRASAQLRDAGERFQVRIAGDGPELPRLKALVAELGLEAEVSFTGWVKDPLGFIRELDLFVVPSRHESFGLVLIEAMAAGVPVVASDTDGPREVLKAGRFGALFPREDPVALAGQMGLSLRDWHTGRKRAVQAQTHALNTYGFDAGRLRLRQTLESLT